MKQYIIIAGILFQTGINQTFAQQTGLPDSVLHLNLLQVWQKAEQFSRAIAIKNKAVDISIEEVKDTKTERLPDIDIGSNIEKATNIPIYEDGLFNTPTQHEVIHTLYKVGVDLYLNIYNGNKLNLKIEEKEIVNKLTVIQRGLIISDIHYKSAVAYLDLQKAIIFRALIQSDIEDQKKQLAEIREFYKNGVVLKTDLLRVELDLSKRELALVQIGNDIQIANQKLNIIIGEKDDQLIELATISDVSLDNITNYDDCLKEAFKHSFQYHIAKQQTIISKIKLEQVKANKRPKIGFYTDFYYADPQIFLYPYNPYLYSLGLFGIRASFPLSSFYQNVHKERAAKAEVEQEEIADKDVADKVRQQVKEAYLRYKESLVRVNVAENNVTLAIENARINKQTYFNHTTLVTDLLDADVQLLQTKFELASAKIMAQNNYYLLQNIIGTL